MFFCPLLSRQAHAIIERETNKVFGDSTLEAALRKWANEGGDLRDMLSSDDDQPVKTKAEATTICAALDALRFEPGRNEKDAIVSTLHTLAALFQEVETEEAFESLKQNGLPRLRGWVRDLLDGRDVNEDDVLFILKILAMYQQHPDVALIAEAARKPILPDGYMWSVILGQFRGDHRFSAEIVDALRDPLPSHFMLIAYLDLVNGLAIAGKLDRHPFDSQAGQKHLKAWLLDPNKENFSFAHSATAALPFVDPSLRGELMQHAHVHPDPSVRMEAAWAQAKSGDPEGIESLSKFCLDPRHSHMAQQYLDELGHADRIPEEAQRPEFQAVAELSNWLTHPSEFGRPPDCIELMDTRELFWPPTNDFRQLSLVRYAYHDPDGSEPTRGVGMVGSVTFALFGEATVDLSPQDIYGLHCCWELEINHDSRAPEKRTAEAGREILEQHNDDF